MASFGFKISFEPLITNTQLEKAIDALMMRMKDFTPVWLEARDLFAAHESEVFASQGPEWAALADSTVLRKSFLEGGDSLLIEERTGALESSFSSEGMDFIPTAMSVTMGSMLSYALYQQTGKDSHPGQPARDLVHITAADAMAFWRLIDDYLYGVT